MKDSTFPATPEDLTSRWLSDALGCDVKEFAVKRFSEGAGVIGQVVRLELETGGHGPATVIAKFASPAPENRAVAKTYDMYGREVVFYSQIAPTLKLRLPRCFFAAIDRENYTFALLLEDLQGMRIGDQVAGCSLEDAKAVLRAVAALHAAGWELRNTALVSHNNPAQRDGMCAGLQAGWPVVCEKFPDVMQGRVHEVIGRLPERVPALLEQMCTAPVALAHADVRLDNIFFGSDGVTLVDWQSVCLSAPEQDVAYFITQSVPEAVRQAEDLPRYYYDALRVAGVDYSYEQFWSRYRVCTLYLMCYAVIIAGTLDLGNERGIALGRTLLKGAVDALEETDAYALL